MMFSYGFCYGVLLQLPVSLCLPPTIGSIVLANAVGHSIIVYWETEDPQRTLREMANSQAEADKMFRQVIENAAPAIDLSKENPFSNELLFEWQQLP